MQTVWTYVDAKDAFETEDLPKSKMPLCSLGYERRVEIVSEKHVPIRGMLAIETKIVLDRLAKAQPGECVPYAELDTLTGCNVRKRRNVITTAVNKLLSEQAKVFLTERGKGIRLLTNEEIPSIGARDISRVGRIAKRSIRRLAATDYDKLSEQGKILHNTHMTILALVQRGATAKSLALIQDAVAKRTNPLPVGETLKLFSSS